MGNNSNQYNSKLIRKELRATIGTRIAAMRARIGLTQAKLAELITEREKLPIPLSTTVISFYENNRRVPRQDRLSIIAGILGCTPEYLMGITDNPLDGGKQITDKKPDTDAVKAYIDYRAHNGVLTILPNDYALFHGRPVFIQFKPFTHISQWGLVNANERAFILTNAAIRFDEPTIDYVSITEPDYRCYTTRHTRHTLNMSELLDISVPIWIEMTTDDSQIRIRYNGWYHHNEDHTCLISNDGLLLPYTGLNISFHAYVDYFPDKDV